MAYVNDASTLADVVGPAYVAQQTGIQNEQANQEQAIKNQVAAGQAPAEIQKPFLANLFQQQQTAAETGTAAQQLAAGNIAQQAQQSGANAAIAGNQLKMTQDQAQKLGQLGQLAGQAAGYLDSVPPAARPAAMAQLLQANNIDPSQLGPLASGDPDILRKASASMAQASQSFVQQTALEAQRGQVQQNVATTEATGHVQAAQAGAEARKYAADQQLKIREFNQNIDQSIASLGKKIAAAGAGADPNDIALMRTLQQQQITARQMAATNTAYLVGQGAITQAPTFNPVGAPTQAPATNNTPAAQPPTGNAVEAEMRRRGLLK